MTQPLTKSSDDGATVANSTTASNGRDSTKDYRSFDDNSDQRASDDDDHNSLNEYRMSDATATLKGASVTGASSEVSKSVGDNVPEDDYMSRLGFPGDFDIFDPDDEPAANMDVADTGKKIAKPNSPEDTGVDKALPDTKGSANGPDLDGMAKWFENNFDSIDKDKDGVLSKDELDHSLLDPKLATGDGAIYLSTANDKTKNWAENFGSEKDDKGMPKDGITRDSLTKMREAAKTQESKENQEKAGIGKLDDDMHNIDRDGDQCITKAELDEALKQDHWTKEQLQNLENLKEKFSEVAKTTDDSTPPVFSGDSAYPGTQYGLGLQEEFVSALDLRKYNGDKGNFVEGLKDSIKDRTDNRDSKHPVAQHGLDSCFLLSPLESLEKQQPGAMDKMIKDNGDGTVTVTFPGDPEKPVTIAKPTEGEQAEFTNGKAGIIEKAFADYVSKLPKDEQQKYIERPSEKNPTLIQHKLDGGGLTDSAMTLLTGAEAGGQPVNLMSEKQIIDTLTAASESNQLITAGTNRYTGEESGITPRHAYSVSFDPKTNTITMTNPNKPDSKLASEPTKPDRSPLDGKSDGSFTLTIEQFKKHVDHLYIGRSKK